MPRDYAHTPPSGRRKNYRPLIGWALAAMIVLLVIRILYSQYAPLLSKKTISVKVTPVVHSVEAKQKAVHKKPPTLQFDFYTLLSNSSSKLKLKKHGFDKASQSYMLQVAAFNSKEAAFQLKERLLLLGFNAFVTEHKGHLRYRVNVGKYATLPQAVTEQTRLSDNSFDSLVVKNDSNQYREVEGDHPYEQ